MTGELFVTLKKKLKNVHKSNTINDNKILSTYRPKKVNNKFKNMQISIATKDKHRFHIHCSHVFFALYKGI